MSRGAGRMVRRRYTTRWLGGLFLLAVLTLPAGAREPELVIVGSGASAPPVPPAGAGYTDGSPADPLDRLLDTPPETWPDFLPDPLAPVPPFQVERYPPPGFTGPSGVAPTVIQ